MQDKTFVKTVTSVLGKEYATASKDVEDEKLEPDDVSLAFFEHVFKHAAEMTKVPNYLEKTISREDFSQWMEIAFKLQCCEAYFETWESSKGKKLKAESAPRFTAVWTALEVQNSLRVVQFLPNLKSLREVLSKAFGQLVGNVKRLYGDYMDSPANKPVELLFSDAQNLGSRSIVRCHSKPFHERQVHCEVKLYLALQQAFPDLDFRKLRFSVSKPLCRDCWFYFTHKENRPKFLAACPDTYTSSAFQVSW